MLLARLPFLVPSYPATRAAAAAASQALTLALGVLWLSSASRLSLPLGSTPVPFTLQPQAVVLLAATFGEARGQRAVLAWLMCASAGAPVLASGAQSGNIFGLASAGYLLSYPVVVALIARRGRGSAAKDLFFWLLAGLFTLLSGTLWLATFMPLSRAFTLGFVPFVLTDAAKLMAAFVARTLWLQPGGRLRR